MRQLAGRQVGRHAGREGGREGERATTVIGDRRRNDWEAKGGCEGRGG